MTLKAATSQFLPLFVNRGNLLHPLSSLFLCVELISLRCFSTLLSHCFQALFFQFKGYLGCQNTPQDSNFNARFPEPTVTYLATDKCCRLFSDIITTVLLEPVHKIRQRWCYISYQLKGKSSYYHEIVSFVRL